MTTHFGTAARIVGLGLIIVIAAALGLVAGNALNSTRNTDVAVTTAGYPAGYQGGAAVPISRTADAAFSLDAVSQLQAIRDAGAGDTAASPTDDEGVVLRKREPAAPTYLDYGLRHSDTAADQEATRYGPPGR